MTDDERPCGPVKAFVLWRGACGRFRIEWTESDPERLRGVALTWLTWEAPGIPRRTDLVDVLAAGRDGICRGRTRRVDSSS